MDSLLKAVGIAALLLIGGCGILTVIGAVAGGKAAHDVQQEIQRQDQNAVPLATFNQIQQGMTYQQVVGLIGREGTVMSENNIAGIHTAMYSWEAGFAASMTVMFQNGGVIQKSQFGMK